MELYSKLFAMETLQQFIPVDIAKIMVAYFSDIATEKEKDKLDEWVCATDDNMQLFCEWVDTAAKRLKKFDPFQDDYTPMEYWILAEYFIKHGHKKIGDEERRWLNRWRSADTFNDELFRRRPAFTDRREMYDWLMAEQKMLAL